MPNFADSVGIVAGFNRCKQTTMTRDAAENYVDRISVIPGQMTTYGVGEMHFINLRKEAENRLGNKFDIKAFHDKCLTNGTVPLNYSDIILRNWFKSETKNQRYRNPFRLKPINH